MRLPAAILSHVLFLVFPFGSGLRFLYLGQGKASRSPRQHRLGGWWPLFLVFIDRYACGPPCRSVGCVLGGAGFMPLAALYFVYDMINSEK